MWLNYTFKKVLNVLKGEFKITANCLQTATAGLHTIP